MLAVTYEEFEDDLRCLLELADQRGRTLFFHPTFIEHMDRFPFAVATGMTDDEFIHRALFDHAVIAVGLETQRPSGVAAANRWPEDLIDLHLADVPHAVVQRTVNVSPTRSVRLEGSTTFWDGLDVIVGGSVQSSDRWRRDRPEPPLSPEEAWANHVSRQSRSYSDYLAEVEAYKSNRPQQSPAPPTPPDMSPAAVVPDSTTAPPAPPQKVDDAEGGHEPMFDWGCPFEIPAFGGRSGRVGRHRGAAMGMRHSASRAVLSLDQLHDLIEEEGGDPNDWTEHRVNEGGRSVWLPRTFGDEWDAHVSTVAQSVEVDDGRSSVGSVRREEICHSGDIWMIVCSDDSGMDVNVVGEFPDMNAGLWACICRSRSFVAGPSRSAVAAEEHEGFGVEQELLMDWLEFDEVFDAEARPSEAEQRALAALASMRIVDDSGTLLLGSPAALLPTGCRWVLPMSEDDRADLTESGGDVKNASITVQGATSPAALLSAEEPLALALAKAHGLREVVVLDGDFTCVVDISGYHQPVRLDFKVWKAK